MYRSLCVCLCVRLCTSPCFDASIRHFEHRSVRPHRGLWSTFQNLKKPSNLKKTKKLWFCFLTTYNASRGQCTHSYHYYWWKYDRVSNYIKPEVESYGFFECLRGQGSKPHTPIMIIDENMIGYQITSNRKLGVMASSSVWAVYNAPLITLLKRYSMIWDFHTRGWVTIGILPMEVLKPTETTSFRISSCTLGIQ
jgi:hypothetical protein